MYAVFVNVSTLRNRTFTIFTPYVQLIRKYRLSEEHIKWQMLLLLLWQHLLFRNTTTLICLLYISTSCPASGSTSHTSNTELIIFLCKLMLIFLYSLFLLKAPIPSLSSSLETEESFSLLSSFFPEPINCFICSTSFPFIPPFPFCFQFSNSCRYCYPPGLYK